ncbi:unnamed protein product, partial [Scytosiphon promiscuus]
MTSSSALLARWSSTGGGVGRAVMSGRKWKVSPREVALVGLAADSNAEKSTASSSEEGEDGNGATQASGSVGDGGSGAGGAGAGSGAKAWFGRILRSASSLGGGGGGASQFGDGAVDAFGDDDEDESDVFESDFESEEERKWGGTKKADEEVGMAAAVGGEKGGRVRGEGDGETGRAPAWEGGERGAGIVGKTAAGENDAAGRN